jgi:hypothetical protein
LAPTSSAPPAGSGYLVPRSPLAVSTAWRSSRSGYHVRRSARLRRTCGWLAYGVSSPAVPSPGPQAGETTLRGFLPLRHKPARRIRLIPGVPRPGTFRPQGFALPSRRLTPLRTWRRPVSRRSAHGVRPSGSCSSRPAVPLSGPRLSCRFLQPPRTGVVATPEVFSGPGRDPTRPRTRRGRPDLALLGFGPSKAFSSHRPRTGFPVLAPHTLPAGSAPYVSTSGRGSRGLLCGGIGWSLSRLPAFLGFCT